MKIKQLQLDINHYADDCEGAEAFLDDFYLASIPRLIQKIYNSNNFKQYYAHMEQHTREMMALYERMMARNYIWKSIIEADTILSKVPYKRFFIDELIKGLQKIDSSAIIN